VSQTLKHIQGGKKIWPQAYSAYSEDQNFFPTKEAGQNNKNLNIEHKGPA
jgi:hypothetical protein